MLRASCFLEKTMYNRENCIHLLFGVETNLLLAKEWLNGVRYFEDKLFPLRKLLCTRFPD